MKEQLTHHIDQALRSLLDDAGDAGPVPEFALDVPRQAEHGDFSCNAAMMLAKRLRKAPRAIAEDFAGRLGDAGGLVARVEIAGPGFVNMWLETGSWQDLLQQINQQGADFGASDVGRGKKVQVEFVSANPTGPLSVGHGRQAVLGDCIARLYQKCGYEVVREYYFNDGGRQMRVLGESVKARYLELLGKAAPPPAAAMADPEGSWQETVDGLPVAFPKDGYQGDYIRDIGQKLIDAEGEGLVDEPGDGRFRDFAQAEIFEDINGTLGSIGVEFDTYFGERSLYDDGKLEQAIQALRDRDLIFESDGATWLAATRLDLDRDRVVIKSTGEPTYLMPDIAYHLDKYERGFDLIIDVLGADHIEQFPFVQRAMGALGQDMERLQLVMHQFVTVTSGGQKVKQSTRKATFITIDELVEDVGVDVFRFFMIERKPEGHLDFDLELAKDRNWRKNPAFYVQYAHARTHGIERKAAEEGVAMPAPDGFDPARLDLPEEIDIVRKLGEFPDVVQRAAESQEPHHMAYYLRELAGLWNPYLQDGQQHRVVSDDAELTAARLGLVLAVRSVLRSGLELLGVNAVERM